jgi:predicted membrane-bound spermidine synthase
MPWRLRLVWARWAPASRAPTRSPRWPKTTFYQDRVVFTATTPYQRIVVTSGRGGHRLFLNGNLQFAERDEYRYHEALVHPVMSAHGAPKKVAVLGGGDGMAVRECSSTPAWRASRWSSWTRP